MRKVFEYSHLGGRQILQVDFPEINREIEQVIEAVDITEKTKISYEKTKLGRVLFSPTEMNRRFTEAFRSRGYSKLRDSYTVEIPGYPVRVPGAFKEIDFVKDRVLIEVQLGKYAFMFYDVAKFQYFFNENHADVGVEIVPCHALHRQMSSGVSYGEQLIYDIERLKRHFPSVPIKVILVDV